MSGFIGLNPQTMTYAHLVPDYLQDAVMLNPLIGGLTVHGLTTDK
ncbi:hypothetical protein ACZ87_00997 [Candidatus Erwinia dacicola]|uniref:Uncharacterized protein n=1 Tax=Candidatus Erwinia dacicola TaxID=252393 RepID=A0A328TPM7_9GAMM|nr:hypothetical protein ACZ87_00997 [Candidatus Erwinia dacicola]